MPSWVPIWVNIGAAAVNIIMFGGSHFNQLIAVGNLAIAYLLIKQEQRYGQ